MMRLAFLLAALAAGPWAAGEAVARDGGSQLTIRGPQVAGGLIQGRTVADAQVRFAGKTVPVDSQGRFLFGLHRDDRGSHTLRVTLPSGERMVRTLDIRGRSYGTQEIDNLPPYLVDPDEEFLDRINREAEKARQVRRRVRRGRAVEGGFRWPVGGIVTGVYGTKRVLNGKPRQPHFGVDIAADKGTPVRAPADGRVALAHPGMFFSGKTLFLDHGQGLHTSYLHLASIRVQDGERVERGEIIATVGSTGRSTGPHLDWRASWRESRLDPALLPGIRNGSGGLDLAAGDRIHPDLASSETEIP
jgi:hypothetical protein